MPNHDGTGPQGNGPMTGRQLGRCGQNAALGQGRGKGLGRQARLSEKNDTDAVAKNTANEVK